MSLGTTRPSITPPSQSDPLAVAVGADAGDAGTADADPLALVFPPLAFRFYLRRETMRAGQQRLRGLALAFADKFAQAGALIARLGRCCQPGGGAGGQGQLTRQRRFFRPLRDSWGSRVYQISCLRINAVLYFQPHSVPDKLGQLSDYGARLGAG